MIRPGPRLARWFFIAAALGCAAPLWWPLGFLALGGAAAIAGAAAWERHVLQGAAKQVRVIRRPVVALSIGRPGEVTLTLINDGQEPLHCALRSVWPDLIGGGSTSAVAECPPGREVTVALPIIATHRGTAVLPPPVIARSRHGLIEWVAPAGEPARVDVLPDLEAVRRLHRQLTSFFLRGHGARMAPRVGQGREFDRLRDYVLGDDYRHIAWKASARRSRLVVREFRVERAQDVLVCVDRGHRMSPVVAGGGRMLTRADHAVNAAVLTAWLCNRCEDRVGMLSFAADVERGVMQGRGASHLAAITAFATGITSAALHSDYRALAAHLRRRLRQRTLVMIATVLPERGDEGELLAAMRMLAPRHLPLVLVLDDRLLDAEADALPSDHPRLCRALAASDIVDSRRQLMRELRQLGALVVQTPPGEAGIAAVNAYLDVKRRQLL